MKNTKFKFGICFSLLSVLTIGAACYISSDPSQEYFGEGETTVDHVVEITPTKNNNIDFVYPHYSPITLEEGWPINLKGNYYWQTDDPSTYLFKFNAPNDGLFFGNRHDEDQNISDVNKIDGITSFTVDFDYQDSKDHRSDLILQTWHSGDQEYDLRATDQILKPGVAATFPDLHPSYFNLKLKQAPGYEWSGSIFIKSIKITYTCKASESPFEVLNQLKVYYSNDHTASISGFKNLNDNRKILNIPSKVCAADNPNDFYTVTTIDAQAFDNNKYLEEVIIPNTVTTIGVGAFRNNTSLSKVSLPSSVNTIKDQAFLNTRIKNIDLSHVEILGESAFEGCHDLTKADITNVKEAGYFVFKDSGLSEITFSNFLTSVPYMMFLKSQLKSITLTDKVTEIERAAFQDCMQLTSVNNANNVTKVAEYAFTNCYQLADIQLPKVTTIENNAFHRCRSLTMFTIPATCTSIGNNVFFNDTNEVTIMTPFECEQSGWSGSFISYDDFRKDIFVVYNINGNHVVYKDSIYELNGEYAELVSFTDTEAFAFDVKDEVFIGGKLRKVNYVRENAFNNCTALKYIRVHGNINGANPLAKNAINNCGSLTLLTSFDLKDADKESITNTQYDVINVGQEAVLNRNVKLDKQKFGDMQITYCGGYLLKYIGNGRSDGTIVVPDFITHICSNSILNVKKDIQVIIFPNIVSIAKNAITYPSYHNTGTPAIFIKNDASKVTIDPLFNNGKKTSITYNVTDDYIMEDNFKYVYSNTQSEGVSGVDGLTVTSHNVIIDESFIKDVVIPETVTINNKVYPVRVIADNLGNFDGAKTVSLPSSLVKIGDGFFDTIKYLEKVTFNGTMAEFNKIVMSETTRNLITGKVTCTDGTL